MIWNKRNYDLEDRLVDYSCRMIDVVEALPKTRAGKYIAGQLIRSCISPTFNYGEVQAPSPGMTLFTNWESCFQEIKRMQAALKDYLEEAID
jgi:hypothetical protein